MKPACKVEKKCKFLKILIHMTNYNKCSLYVPILLFIYLFISDPYIRQVSRNQKTVIEPMKR